MVDAGRAIYTLSLISRSLEETYHCYCMEQRQTETKRAYLIIGSTRGQNVATGMVL